MYSPMKKFFCFICLAYLSFPMKAQEALSLDSCRALAISNNKELLISQEKSTLPTIKGKRHLLITFPTFRPAADICAVKRVVHPQRRSERSLVRIGYKSQRTVTAGCPSHRTASSRTGRPIAGFRTKPGRCPRRCRPILG